jgi:hypothetical protein
MGVGGKCYFPMLCSGKETQLPMYRSLGEPQGWGLDGWENLAPTGIRSLDHPAITDSLYCLYYPGPWKMKEMGLLIEWNYCEHTGYVKSLILEMRLWFVIKDVMVNLSMKTSLIFYSSFSRRQI